MPPKTAAPKPLTHFLCLPLVTTSSRPQLQKSFQTFRAYIKDEHTPENPNGISDKAIRPVGTLHLTLGVLSLLTSDRIDAVVARLRSLDLSSLLENSTGETHGIADGADASATANASDAKDTGTTSVKVTLRGLVSMHDPAKTSILYSSPDDLDSRLYQFCNRLREAFVEFLVPDTRPLLLHATILNTVYVPGVRDRRGGAGVGHGKRKAKITIDARGILEKYESVEWMEDVRVEKVAICRMGAERLKDAEGVETGEEEYVAEAEVDLPRMG